MYVLSRYILKNYHIIMYNCIALMLFLRTECHCIEEKNPVHGLTWRAIILFFFDKIKHFINYFDS